MFSVVFSPFIGGNGVTNTSYALPEVTSSLPDTFTSKLGTDLYIYGNSSRFKINQYVTDNNIQVYCLEKNIQFVEGTSYKKGDAITDYGLLYLMANSYPNVDFKDSEGNKLGSALQTWITQVSIWLYQKEVGAANSNNLTDEEIAGIMNDTYVDIGVQYDASKAQGANLAEGQTLYSVYIRPLVDAAKNHRNTPNKSLEVTIASDKVTLDAEEKYYQSSLITVTGAPSDNFNGYKLELRNYPEGTIVIDENGNKMDLQVRNVSTVSDDTYMYIDNVNPGTKFYLKVPVSEVTEETKTVDIYVLGSFTVYDGNYYVADGAQTITSVKTVNNNIDKGLEVTFNYTPDVEDTKMDISQTVYFIGLLILLAGVGIIYANVLPKKEQ